MPGFKDGVSASQRSNSGTYFMLVTGQHFGEDDNSPILVSKQDTLTPGTARQILVHNEQGTAACHW